MSAYATSSPQRVSGSRERWALLDTDAARAHEAQARAIHPAGTLMQRAGLAVARLALALAPGARWVTVVCGPGDNGGDGLVAARLLHATGWQVRVHHTPGARPPSADTADALDALLQAGLAPSPCPDRLAATDLVIDALLGLGSSRRVSGPGLDATGLAVARAIAAIRAQHAPVLAIDLPSGLHPDTGAVTGELAVVARATLCPLSLRPGCFTHQGRDHAGEVWLDDLGHPATRSSAWLSAAPAPIERPHASHKGRFGDVVVLGGAEGMSGAAVLAAEAALAAGAGRVYLVPLDERSLAAPRHELMLRPLVWAHQPATLAAATVVVGCGGGDRIAAALPPLLHHAARLVLDADALNAIAAEAALRSALRMRAQRGLPTLLTPHPLEAARLLGCDAAAVQHDRFAAATALASSLGATVLLKGSGSVIAAPGAPLLVNPSGNAALASAGTGDVLAGWLGGAWAGLPDSEPGAIAAATAWRHGHAADRFAQACPGRPLRAAALIEQMLQAD
jgi:ADP-dependent NAD(P)H-hydrate dehydratase / NAD(P)H-hydrate epimerase